MNCIKCGREVPEGQMFCQQCKLPPMVMAAVPVTAKKPSTSGTSVKKKKKRKKFDFAKALRQMRTALVVVSLLFAALAATVAIETGDYLSRKDHLRQREANVTLREKEADNRDSRIEELEQEVASLQEKLQEAETIIAFLQSDSSHSRR